MNPSPQFEALRTEQIKAIHAAVRGDLSVAQKLLDDDEFWRQHEALEVQFENRQRAEREEELRNSRARRWDEIPATYKEEFDPAKSKLPRHVIQAVKGWKPEHRHHEPGPHNG